VLSTLHFQAPGFYLKRGWEVAARAARPRAVLYDQEAVLNTAARPCSGQRRVLSRSVLEFDWHGLRLDEDTWSGSKVNRLIDEFLGEALPSIDFAHGDLT
jgi:hypothetical protein